MKTFIYKIVLVFTALIVSCNINAQSNEFGTIGVHAGIGVGGYLNIADFKFDGIQVDADSSGAWVIMYPVEVEFGLHKLLSVGLNMKFGKYIDEDTQDEDVTVKTNSISSFGLNLKFYPVNRDKFNMYLGFGVGATRLNQDKVSEFFISIEQKVKWKALNMNPHLGFNAYFGDKLGVFFDLGYDTHKFTLTEYSINGADQDMARYDYKFDAKGLFLDFGIAMKF